MPSNKLLDYVLAGKPIVAYNIPAVREFFKDYLLKILMKPNNCARLAGAILYVFF